MKYFSKITASHYVLPKEVLTDDELSARFDPKKLKGISKLSGIHARRVAPAGVTACDLAFAAADRLLRSESIERSDFDMVVFVTQTPDHLLPATGFILHERLGLPRTCGAFDISLGCPAMPYALSVANGLIASGQCKKILVVFAETITRLVHPKDRTLVPLHGDGAAVFVMERADGDCGFEFADIGADSSGWKHLQVPAGGMRTPRSPETARETVDETGVCTNAESLQMNGAAVFHFAITVIPQAIRESLQKHALTLTDCKLMILHQANKMMLDNIYNQLELPAEKRFFFMEEVGNLSAASTPVTLAEALRQGKLANGGRVLLASFGVGLTWGVYSHLFAPHSVKASQASTDL